MTGKGQYTELIAMLQQQKVRVNRLIDPNSELNQALRRRLKDLPKDDKNAQTIVEGLHYFRDMNNTIENNIRILQRADKGGA